MLIVALPAVAAAQPSAADTAVLRLVPPGADLVLEVSPSGLGAGTLVSSLLPRLLGQPGMWSHRDAASVDSLVVAARLFPFLQLHLAAARGAFSDDAAFGFRRPLFDAPGRVTAGAVPLGFEGASWSVLLHGPQPTVAAAQLRAASGAFPVELARPLADPLPPAAGRAAVVVPAAVAPTLGLAGTDLDLGFLAGAHLVGRFGPRPTAWLEVAALFPGEQAASDAERHLPDLIRYVDRASRPIIDVERFGRRVHLSVRRSQMLAGLVGGVR